MSSFDFTYSFNVEDSPIIDELQAVTADLGLHGYYFVENRGHQAGILEWARCRDLYGTLPSVILRGARYLNSRNTKLEIKRIERGVCSGNISAVLLFDFAPDCPFAPLDGLRGCDHFVRLDARRDRLTELAIAMSLFLRKIS